MKMFEVPGVMEGAKVRLKSWGTNEHIILVSNGCVCVPSLTVAEITSDDWEPYTAGKIEHINVKVLWSMRDLGSTGSVCFRDGVDSIRYECDDGVEEILTS